MQIPERLFCEGGRRVILCRGFQGKFLLHIVKDLPRSVFFALEIPPPLVGACSFGAD